MKRFLVMMLLVGAFGGGYYVRGLNGSPDVFGWAEKNYPRFAQAAGQICGQLGEENPPASSDPRGPAAPAGQTAPTGVTAAKSVQQLIDARYQELQASLQTQASDARGSSPHRSRR